MTDIYYSGIMSISELLDPHSAGPWAGIPHSELPGSNTLVDDHIITRMLLRSGVIRSCWTSEWRSSRTQVHHGDLSQEAWCRIQLKPSNLSTDCSPALLKVSIQKAEPLVCFPRCDCPAVNHRLVDLPYQVRWNVGPNLWL